MQRIRRTLRVHREAESGSLWQARLEEFLPSYLSWFDREGERARPGYLDCERALGEWMPELVPVWKRLVALAGGGDRVARLLSLWCPPPFLAGCSQIVWPHGGPALVRNYDYSPRLWEAVIWQTSWNGSPTLVSSDCLWGALDGMNGHGLAVSLSFGGRSEVGRGFGMPLILRYVLETCRDVASAIEVLTRVPSHMAYNITLLDRSARHATVQVAPGGGALVLGDRVATNHQEGASWSAFADRTASYEREQFLRELFEGPPIELASLAECFQSEPLHVADFSRGYITLYTAVYEPAAGVVWFLWPGIGLRLQLGEPEETERLIEFVEPPPAAGLHNGPGRL